MSENAASTEPLWPTHGLQSQRYRDLNKHQPLQTDASLTKPISLLTQSLATRYENDESVEGKFSSSFDESSKLPAEMNMSPGGKPLNAIIGTTNEKGKSYLPSANLARIAFMMNANPKSSRLELMNDVSSSVDYLSLENNVETLLVSHRNFIGRVRCRGMSLERTKKEKMMHNLSNDDYSSNPGDTGITAKTIPFLTQTISNNPPTDGVRALYRSWRGSIAGLITEKPRTMDKNNTSQNNDGFIEKSIKEALTSVEPSARSRKASHHMRFFKEGLCPDDTRTRGIKNKGSQKEQMSNYKVTLSQDRQANNSAAKIEVDLCTKNFQLKPSLDIGKTKPRKLAELGVIYTEGVEAPSCDRLSSADRFCPQEPDSTTDDVLNDSRGSQILSLSSQKDASFSGVLPTTSRQITVGLEPEIPSRVTSKQTDTYINRYVKSVRTQNSDEDEDEDSGEEQISSALFLPHQTSQETTERFRDTSDSNLRSKADHQDAPNSEKWLEKHTVLPLREAESHPKHVRRTKSQSGYDAGHRNHCVRETHHQSWDNASSYLKINPPRQNDSSFHVEEIAVNENDMTHTDSSKIFTPFADSAVQIRSEQTTVKRPLDAIELIPYSHQVGGHTTLWRFSKRAVCKQLNNRENEFYEKIEQYHPQLLEFLPRYIGVLNVTFEKQNRRKPICKSASDPSNEQLNFTRENIVEAPQAEGFRSSEGQISRSSQTIYRRTVDQSYESSQPQPIPTVTFADNRHIIPTSILKPQPELSELKVGLTRNQDSLNCTIEPDKSIEATNSRPTNSVPDSNPWGKTHVNKMLRDDVFREVFLQKPVPIRHKKPATYRAIPFRKNNLRNSNSESNLSEAKQDETHKKYPCVKEAQIDSRKINPKDISYDRQKATAENLNHETTDIDLNDQTGRSAPEPEIPFEKAGKVGKRQRRYSSGGLRRRPTQVAADRGQLKYFEEADDAGFKGDPNIVFTMDLELGRENISGSNSSLDSNNNYQRSSTKITNSLQKCSSSTDSYPDEDNLSRLPELPRPVNPKEARAQPGSRVEYFLLLEDLTAGMKRPCIMDLKMGTRQYGVDANPKKQKSQRKKCAATTSKELGVRVCGLQVWDESTQDYLFEDKYYGRNLRAGDEFQKALTRFLYDGTDYSSVLRHIPLILQKLSELEVLIRGLLGYRFYGTSLLMFYDGAANIDHSSDNSISSRDESITLQQIDFKIADFANCVTRENFAASERTCPPQHPNMPDMGFLRGLKSLKRYFSAIQRESRINIDTKHSKCIHGSMNHKFATDLAYDVEDGYISY